MHYIEAAKLCVPSGNFSAPRTSVEYEAQASQGRLLAAIVDFRKPKVIVEIGVSCGVTTSLLCGASQFYGGHVYGFDIWAQHGFWNQIPPFAQKQVTENILFTMGYRNYTMTQIDTRTPEFPKILAELCPKIDFVFIDACHSYQGAMNDFQCIYPLLTDDGIVAFHDTGWIDGSREVMLDIRAKYNDGTFDVIDIFGNDNAGVSILFKRSLYNRERYITNICGSNSPPEEIIRREQEWYKAQKKDPGFSPGSVMMV